jgi:hypothetical protein
MGEQAGGAAVGELLEALVDVLFELAEGVRIASKLLGPLFLVLGEGSVEILKGLLQRRNG